MSKVDWNTRLCGDIDPDTFFEDSSEELAQKICKRCPIRWECLNFAIEFDERHGVWGGMTAQDRKNIKFKRIRVKCPYCSNVILDETKTRMVTCLACGLSWLV